MYVYAAPGTKTKAHLVEGHREFIEKDLISPKFRGLDQITKLKMLALLLKQSMKLTLV